LSLWNEILLIAILIGLNAFFAGAEIAILSVRDVRIRQLAEEGHRSAQIVMRLTQDSSRMLATIQIGITLTGFLASAAAAVGISGSLGSWLASLPIPWDKGQIYQLI
jgi:putative hemolysin